jgi:esterase/lipase superfamily enzyme
MRQEEVGWHSPRLGRDMRMLVFGHGGARVIVFPTSLGSYVEYRDRGMIDVLGHHIHEGWLQVYCVESFDGESWYADHLPPTAKIANHLRYESYLIDEVLPYSANRNPNPFVIATGCSFGAFHAMLLGLRRPDRVNRVVGLSGAYDAGRWLDGYHGLDAYFVDPLAFVGGIRDEEQRRSLRGLDIIFTIGGEDPNFSSNVRLYDVLWSQGIWHAFRPEPGWGHDWPYWQDRILRHIGGPDSR